MKKRRKIKKEKKINKETKNRNKLFIHYKSPKSIKNHKWKQIRKTNFVRKSQRAPKETKK